MQDPNSAPDAILTDMHTDAQTNIESVIHQDELQTMPTEAVVSRANGSADKGRVKVPAANGNGNGSPNGNGKQSNFRLNNAPGLTMERRFTKPGEDVYSTVEWEIRSAVIANERGEKVFEQTGVEIPKSWTQLATNVVVSKYFRGHIGTPEREHNVRQLISRVADTIAVWGRKMDYFATETDAQAFQDELTHILLHQKAAFNSPVWFNVGLADQPVPQASACQPYHARVLTQEGLVSIGDIVTQNRTGLQVFDGDGLTPIVAVKSNGRKQVYRIELNDGYQIEATADHLVCAHQERRAERLEWRRVDELAVGMKMRVYPHAARTHVATTNAVEVSEAALAGWLQADGFVGQYATGTNRSLTLEFMTDGEEEHKWVLDHLDVVFPNAHFKIRDVETQDADMRLRRVRLYGEHLRPFVQKYDLLTRGVNMRVPAVILTAPDEAVIAYLSSVYQSEGYVSFNGTATHVGMAVISQEWARDIQALLSRLGIYTRRSSKREARADRHDTHVLDIALLSERAKFAQCVGFISQAKSVKLLQSLGNKGKRCPDIRYSAIKSIEPVGEMDVYDIQTGSGQYLSEGVLVHNCFINGVEDTMESILTLAKTEGMLFKYGSGTGTNLSTIRGSNEPLRGGGTASGPLSFMRGFDQLAGAVKSGGKTRRAAKMALLDITHPDIEGFIVSKADEEKKAHALIDAGYSGAFNVAGGAYDSVLFQNGNHSVRVTDTFMQTYLANGEWTTRNVTDGKPNRTYKAADLMNKIGASAWVCGDPGMQYDTTINKWHTCKNSDKINASNPCSEFVFLDNTACNLSSLNLMKFRTEDGEFDVAPFLHACRVMITAQEILVDNASYPTPRIQENSHDYRPLGLGYANLGALLMARGVPYDSDAGRAYAGAITALMTGEAYHQSAVIARDHGWAFPGYKKNREPMLDVMRMHREAVETIDGSLVPAAMLTSARKCWDDAVATGTQHGYRNAQSTVLAPTGCLVGSSLVVTDRGLARLTRLGNPDGAQWQSVQFRVLTDEGEQQATQFYVNGIELTRRIVTKAGYAIQGTLKHRVKVVDTRSGEWQWKRFADIAPGDIVPMSMGRLTGKPQTVLLPPLGEEYWTGDYTTVAPRTVTPGLAELVGYFMGDGSLHAKGPRFCVANTDRDVAERIAFLLKSLFNLDARLIEQQGYCEVSAHSVPLALWWEACGFAKHLPHPEHTGKGYRPHVPDAILASNDPNVYGAFARGLFEADGTVTNGVPSWTTTQQTFAEEVKTLLLALGVVTTMKFDTSGWGQSRLYVTRLRNMGYNARFLEAVGFISRRKTDLVSGSESEQTGRHDYVYLAPDVVHALLSATPALQNAALLAMKRHQGGITRRTAQALYAQTGDPRLSHALAYYYDTVTANEDGGEQLTYDISVPENVTYIANGFVSHNTIGFLMDCDTTGIEPDIAIVKYKSLVGGGMMKIVNNTVPEALSHLGYTPSEAGDILAYIDANDTIEGAPLLKPEHLPIFDCAFKPGNGERSIHYMGHVRMMAAAQPFLSGAISKTVNMPTDATAEDITGVYVEGWKLGLKAIAIYRDGSKRTQPLNTKRADTPKEKEEKAEKAAQVAPAAVPAVVVKPLRRKLPDERAAVTHKFSIAGHEGYITVGMYPDGTPGEIFLTMSKEGSTISGLMDSFATAISLALQYGVPLPTLVDKFAHARFEPSGVTNNPDIRFAKSIMDYIFRWLGSKFLNRVPEATQPTLSNGHTEENGMSAAMNLAEADIAPRLTLTASPLDGRSALEQREHETFQNQADAPICTECGSLMVRNGACFKCLNCGSVFGCS